MKLETLLASTVFNLVFIVRLLVIRQIARCVSCWMRVSVVMVVTSSNYTWRLFLSLLQCFFLPQQKVWLFNYINNMLRKIFKIYLNWTTDDSFWLSFASTLEADTWLLAYQDMPKRQNYGQESLKVFSLVLITDDVEHCFAIVLYVVLL